MATTADYLNQLKTDKDNLVKNLKGKGVSASDSEKFTTLVSKVNDISFPEIHDASYLFYNKARQDEIDTIISLCKNITNAKCMFQSAGLANLDLSALDTSKVTDMSYMFYNMYALKELNLNGFATSNVTNMSDMFSSCSLLTSLDLSSFNTENVISMEEMFRDCRGITTLDLSNFNTSNVTNMTYMFRGMSNLTNLNISSFDTSKNKNFSYMFESCKFTNLDLSFFDTSSATNFSGMFYSCSKLENLDCSSFECNFSNKLSYLQLMFYQCTSLKHLDIRKMVLNDVRGDINLFVSGVPTDCEIIVKDDTEKTWWASKYPTYTNVKTVAEYEAK